MRFSIPIKHFSVEEIMCLCGCGIYNINSNSLMMLDLLRDSLGYPLHLNSACRCRSHNLLIGGSETSSHISTNDKCSYAFDVRVKNDLMRFDVVKKAIELGFNRIGVYKTFVHLDNDVNKPSAVWYGHK